MEILKANLDEVQLEAASRLERNSLILAGPGSGKTHMLTERVAFLIRATPNASFRVLCLIFTVEAAKEMRRRLIQKSPRGALGRVTVMNFHQFALDIIRAYGHLIGLDREFTVLGEADRAELVEDTVASLPFGKVKTISVVDFISKQKGRREYRGDLVQQLDVESLRRIFTEYEQLREERNELDFDDLILKAVELLEQSEWVRQLVRLTFPHIEVDELQDTSLLQLTMLQLLYEPGKSQVFAVADDDQMVYEWRDARPETLNEFEEFFAPDTVILQYNYRCPKNIVTVANRLIERNPDRHTKIVVPVRQDHDGRITLSHFVNLEEQADFVASEILSAVAGKKHRPQDHVVLARGRRSFRFIQDALDAVNLPFVEVGGKDVEYSTFVRLLVGGLRLAAGNSYGADLIRRACAKGNEALGSEIFDVAAVRGLARDLATEFRTDFPRLLSDALNLPVVLRDYGEDTEAFRVERYLAMVELARGESNWRDYAGMLRTILVEFDSLLGRVNMQQDAIRLMTVHGAKGLQFPVVFVPDLCNSAFPNLYFKQNIAEERRLLFVAITRTQEVLHVSWTEVGPSGHPTAASPFVDELVEDSGDIIETIT